MLEKITLLTGSVASMAANAAAGNSPVPEPESISLMLFGLGLIGVIVLRHK